MCSNNSIFGGNSCTWVLALILILACCGGCGCGGYGCDGNDRGCC